MQQFNFSKAFIFAVAESETKNTLSKFSTLILNFLKQFYKSF